PTEPSGPPRAGVPAPGGWIGRRRGPGPSADPGTGAVDRPPRGCPPAEPVPNGDRPRGREPSGLRGRRGGTQELLGRGAPPRSRRAARSGSVADPWISVWCGFWLTPFAEATGVARGEAVHSGPVITPRKERKSSAVRGAPVDRRGHIRVRPARLLAQVEPDRPATILLAVRSRRRVDIPRHDQVGPPVAVP